MINIQTCISILFAVIMSMMTTAVTAGNSISWASAPTSISSDGNDITLNYSINKEKGIVVVQLFDKNWKQIGQKYESISIGSGQITLTLALNPGTTPSETNYLQAKLLDESWVRLVDILQNQEQIHLHGVPNRQVLPVEITTSH